MAVHPVAPSVDQRVEHPWQPVPVCTPDCLPPPDSLPRVGSVRVVARIGALLAVLAGGVVIAAVLPLLSDRRRAETLRGLFRALLRAVGVRLAHSGPTRFGARDAPDDGDGAPGATGVLVVSNHLSWLDVLALNAVQPMRMVAKREIRSWPVLGPLAERIGTLFVDRAGLRSLPLVVAEAGAALRGGAAIGLFPEGTTWCGAASGAFRRAGFQAALDAGVPVRPVAQRLLLPDGSPTTVGAFLGEDTLLDSLLRVLWLPGLVVQVHVLPLLVPGAGWDRRQLARRAELTVAAATGVPAPRGPARPTRPVRAAGSGGMMSSRRRPPGGLT